MRVGVLVMVLGALLASCDALGLAALLAALQAAGLLPPGVVFPFPALLGPDVLTNILLAGGISGVAVLAVVAKMTKLLSLDDRKKPYEQHYEPVYYYAPKQSYAPPQPHYEAPQPHYKAPVPQYKAPEPQYKAPEPQYKAPEPQYKAPEPQYGAPESHHHQAPQTQYAPVHGPPKGDDIIQHNFSEPPPQHGSPEPHHSSTPQHHGAPPQPDHGTSSYSHHKRSIQDPRMEIILEGEEMLSSIVRRDTNGCVAKVMCHLLYKRPDTRTQEENVLLALLINNKEVLASFSTFVVHDAYNSKVPGKATCDKAFPKCPKQEEEFDNFLQET